MLAPSVLFQNLWFSCNLNIKHFVQVTYQPILSSQHFSLVFVMPLEPQIPQSVSQKKIAFDLGRETAQLQGFSEKTKQYSEVSFFLNSRVFANKRIVQNVISIIMH